MDNIMQLESSQEPEWDTFILKGNIDAQAETLLQSLPRKVQRQKVRFDFSQAGRINSMGIALLLRCFRNIKEEKDAEIMVSGLSSMNAMLFKMTGVYLLAKPLK